MFWNIITIYTSLFFIWILQSSSVSRDQAKYYIFYKLIHRNSKRTAFLNRYILYHCKHVYNFNAILQLYCSNYITVTFDKLNIFLLNRSIHFLKKTILTESKPLYFPALCNSVFKTGDTEIYIWIYSEAFNLLSKRRRGGGIIYPTENIPAHNRAQMKCKSTR